MSLSKTVHILFISLLLIGIYLGICVHIAIFAPVNVTQFLFSESGPFETLSAWLWYLLALLCVLNTELMLKTRFFTSLGAALLGLREMDFHKRLFDDSFIKTNFYRSEEIPFMDKLLGIILLLVILFVFFNLAKMFVQGIRQFKLNPHIAYLFITLTILCGGLSKLLDRSSSILRNDFNIKLMQHTEVIIMTIEEGVEMLLPILLVVAVTSYRKILN